VSISRDKKRIAAETPNQTVPLLRDDSNVEMGGTRIIADNLINLGKCLAPQPAKTATSRLRAAHETKSQYSISAAEGQKGDWLPRLRYFVPRSRLGGVAPNDLRNTSPTWGATLGLRFYRVGSKRLGRPSYKIRIISYTVPTETNDVSPGLGSK
jgi:hypothetical protein